MTEQILENDLPSYDDDSLRALVALARKGPLQDEAVTIMASILARIGPKPVEAACAGLAGDPEASERIAVLLRALANTRTVRLQDAAVELELFLVPGVLFTGELPLASHFVFTHRGMERLRHTMTMAKLLSGEALLWNYLRPLCPEELSRMSLARRAALTGNIINETLDPALYAFAPPLPEFTAVPFYLVGMANKQELAKEIAEGMQSEFLRELVHAVADGLPAGPGRFVATGEPTGFDVAMRYGAAEFIALTVQGGLRMGASNLDIKLNDIDPLPGSSAGLRVDYGNHPMDLDPCCYYLGRQDHHTIYQHIQERISKTRARIADAAFEMLRAETVTTTTNHQARTEP